MFQSEIFACSGLEIVMNWLLLLLLVASRFVDSQNEERRHFVLVKSSQRVFSSAAFDLNGTFAPQRPLVRLHAEHGVEDSTNELFRLWKLMSSSHFLQVETENNPHDRSVADVFSFRQSHTMFSSLFASSFSNGTQRIVVLVEDDVTPAQLVRHMPLVVHQAPDYPRCGCVFVVLSEKSLIDNDYIMRLHRRNYRVIKLEDSFPSLTHRLSSTLSYLTKFDRLLLAIVTYPSTQLTCHVFLHNALHIAKDVVIWPNKDYLSAYPRHTYVQREYGWDILVQPTEPDEPDIVPSFLVISYSLSSIHPCCSSLVMRPMPGSSHERGLLCLSSLARQTPAAASSTGAGIIGPFGLHLPDATSPSEGEVWRSGCREQTFPILDGEVISAEPFTHHANLLFSLKSQVRHIAHVHQLFEVWSHEDGTPCDDITERCHWRRRLWHLVKDCVDHVDAYYMSAIISRGLKRLTSRTAFSFTYIFDSSDGSLMVPGVGTYLGENNGKKMIVSGLDRTVDPTVIGVELCPSPSDTMRRWNSDGLNCYFNRSDMLVRVRTQDLGIPVSVMEDDDTGALGLRLQLGFGLNALARGQLLYSLDQTVSISSAFGNPQSVRVRRNTASSWLWPSSASSTSSPSSPSSTSSPSSPSSTSSTSSPSSYSPYDLYNFDPVVCNESTLSGILDYQEPDLPDGEIDLEGTVTIVMTTCKRLDRFLQVWQGFERNARAGDPHVFAGCEQREQCNGEVNSSTSDVCGKENTCRDIFGRIFLSNIVAEVLIIDDDSSPQDRDVMMKEYPFFTFIMKPKVLCLPHPNTCMLMSYTQSQRGHARSLNIALSHVRTRFMVYLEDDWLIQDSPVLHPALTAALQALRLHRHPHPVDSDLQSSQQQRAQSMNAHISSFLFLIQTAVRVIGSSLRSGEPIAQLLFNDAVRSEFATGEVLDADDVNVVQYLSTGGWQRQAMINVSDGKGVATSLSVPYSLHEFGLATIHNAYGSRLHFRATWPGLNFHPGVWDLRQIQRAFQACIASDSNGSSSRLSGHSSHSASASSTTTTTRSGVQTVDYFDVHENGFEIKFSISGHAAGLSVGYLPMILFKHIGQESAYQLNGFTRIWDQAGERNINSRGMDWKLEPLFD